MATIEDLNITKLSEMSTDEALELIRQIRLARRTEVKKTKPRSKKAQKVNLDDIDAEMASKLLDLLKG